MDESGNITLSLRDLWRGEELQMAGEIIQLKQDIYRGHKIALKEIKEKEHVIKYGYPIGHALTTIAPGELVHTHNTKTNLSGTQDYQYTPKQTDV